MFAFYSISTLFRGPTAMVCDCSQLDSSVLTMQATQLARTIPFGSMVNGGGGGAKCCSLARCLLIRKEVNLECELPTITTTTTNNVLGGTHTLSQFLFYNPIEWMHWLL